MRPYPSSIWPVLALVTSFAATYTREAVAEGVLLLSGATASAPLLEHGLALPDGSLAALDALSLAARRLAASDDDLLLWFPDRAEAVRLSALAPQVRVRYACLAHDSEALHPDRTRFAAAEADNPFSWVLSERGRLIWWPEIPSPDACGGVIGLLVAEPAMLAFGDLTLGQIAEAELTLRNLGRVEMNVGNIAVDNSGNSAFSLSADACSGERLMPGAGCALTLRFAPMAIGPVSGHLQAPDTGGGALSVPLTGTGSEFPDVIFASRFAK